MPSGDEVEYRRALSRELDRRIAALDARPAGDALGLADALLVGLLCVATPALLIWLWA